MTPLSPRDLSDALAPANQELGAHERLAEFQVQAQIRDSLSLLLRDSRTNSETLGDVRERLARLEAREEREAALSLKVDGLAAEVATLKSDKDRRDGASGLAAWIFKNWQGLAALVAAAVVILDAKGVLKR